MLFFLNKINHCHIENTIFREAQRERVVEKKTGDRDAKWKDNDDNNNYSGNDDNNNDLD